MQPDTVCSEMARLDFCISELKCDENSEIWQTFKVIAENCGWIASYQELCVVCATRSYAEGLSTLYTEF